MNFNLLFRKRKNLIDFIKLIILNDENFEKKNLNNLNFIKIAK